MKFLATFISLLTYLNCLGQNSSEPCTIYWLDKETGSDEITVKINHRTTALIFPTDIRIDFESTESYDSAVLILTDICRNELLTLTSNFNYFNINLENYDLSNLRENQLFFSIIGYSDRLIDSSRVNNLEMLSKDKIGAVKYDLRRATSVNDSIAIFNKNYLFLNSLYLKKR